MNLSILPGVYVICRLDPSHPIPSWAQRGEFSAMTRTPEELSIVCRQADALPGIPCEPDWRVLKVAGILDFSLTGILASLASPLAAAKISIFAISTFDTDYLLVKADALEQAVDILRAAGHHIDSGQEA